MSLRKILRVGVKRGTTSTPTNCLSSCSPPAGVLVESTLSTNPVASESACKTSHGSHLTIQNTTKETVSFVGNNKNKNKHGIGPRFVSSVVTIHPPDTSGYGRPASSRAIQTSFPALSSRPRWSSTFSLSHHHTPATTNDNIYALIMNTRYRRRSYSSSSWPPPQGGEQKHHNEFGNNKNNSHNQGAPDTLGNARESRSTDAPVAGENNVTMNERNNTALRSGDGHVFKAWVASKTQIRKVKTEAALQEEMLKGTKDLAEEHLKNIRTLNVNQIEELLECKEVRQALAKLGEKMNALDSELVGDKAVPEPTDTQLKLYFRDNFVPFLFFGFLDNSIMLLFGDFFDSYFGVAFGITTLTAAAMGNIVGDCSGIWLTGTVEVLISHMNLKDHGLTFEQRRLTKVQTIKTLGMTCGIFCGCVLGMFPLIWPKEWRLYKSKDESTEEVGDSCAPNGNLA